MSVFDRGCIIREVSIFKRCQYIIIGVCIITVFVPVEEKIISFASELTK